MKAIKILLICFLCLCSGCEGSRVMDLEAFANIPRGSEISEVEKNYGSPIEIRSKGKEQVYIYIERFQLGTAVVKQRRYLFTVRDGKIVEKETTFSNPPSYNEIYNGDYFDSVN